MPARPHSPMPYLEQIQEMRGSEEVALRPNQNCCWRTLLHSEKDHKINNSERTYVGALVRCTFASGSWTVCAVNARLNVYLYSI